MVTVDLLLLWLMWGVDGVLVVAVVVILEVLPVLVRDVAVVHALLILHSGPLPLFISIWVVSSLIKIVPRWELVSLDSECLLRWK